MNDHPEYLENYGPDTVHFALFCCFYHHDLLVDSSQCDLAEIQNLLDLWIRDDRLRVPLIFGRKLYDHFYDHCGNRWVDHIPGNDSWKFLDGQPKGICQYGKLACGPLGILKASQERLRPIRLTLPLWHCSDVGCMTVHDVTLEQFESSIIKIIGSLTKSLNNQLGKRSPWDHVLNDLIEGEVAPTSRKYYDISNVVAHCFTDDERALILERALQSECGRVIRQSLGELPQGSFTSKGSPRDIALRLTPEEQLHCLFLLNDSELVSLVDRVIFDRTIVMPPNEERAARSRPPKRYFVERPSVVSSLGVKERTDAPIVSLCALIWSAYESTNNLGELSWRIRGPGGLATKESLMQFIRRDAPESTIAKLILTSGPITGIAVKELQYTGNIEGPDLIPHLMWKLGFKVPRYSETYQHFRTRLDAFQEAIIDVGAIRNESDRERIRSVGVNLFVSLEHVLDELVSYNTWLLASDHLIQTRNTFDLRDARSIVPKVLGAELSSGAGKMIWNVGGENTMGTLLRYLDECASWMRRLLSIDRTAHLRREEDMPHYAEHIERDFAFNHTVFWADVSPGVLADFVSDFSGLVKKFEQAKAPPIRNGIDHQRTATTFPTLDEMRLMAAKLREAFDHADFGRYLPKEFWMEEGKRDSYGRTEYTYRDYLGRKASIQLPELTEGTRGLDGDHAVLIPPGALLGQHSALTFGIRDTSAYADYWRDYPRRRTIA